MLLFSHFLKYEYERPLLHGKARFILAMQTAVPSRCQRLDENQLDYASQPTFTDFTLVSSTRDVTEALYDIDRRRSTSFS